MAYKVITGILNKRMKTYAEQALTAKEHYRSNNHYLKYDRIVSYRFQTGIRQYINKHLIQLTWRTKYPKETYKPGANNYGK